MTALDSTAPEAEAPPSLSDRARRAWAATAQEREVKLAERRQQQQDNALGWAVRDVGTWLGEDVLAEFDAQVIYVSEERREVTLRHRSEPWALLHTRCLSDVDIERRLELVAPCPEAGPGCRGEVVVPLYITSLADLGAALEQRPMPCPGCAPCLHAGGEALTSTAAEAKPAWVVQIKHTSEAAYWLQKLEDEGYDVEPPQVIYGAEGSVLITGHLRTHDVCEPF